MNRRKYKPENRFFAEIKQSIQEERTEFINDFESTTKRAMSMVMFVCFICIVVILIYDMFYAG